jgi:AraC family transcriptional regulator
MTWRIANFSQYHFHRVFRGMVGESVKEHIRRLRLERAAHRLRFSGQPVTDIAFDAGYETHESFTRAFHAMFGEPPAEFRKNHRIVAHGPAPSGVHFVADGTLDRFRPARCPETEIAVRIEELPVMRVAFVRHVGPYDEVGAAWGRLMAWAGPRGLFMSSPVMLAIVYDDPEVTAPERFRYDAAITVSDAVTGEKDIGIQQTGGSRYAVATHRGPYKTIGDTYAELCGQWLPKSGRELHPSPALEFYRNSPQNTRDEDLVTDIYLALAI